MIVFLLSYGFIAKGREGKRKISLLVLMFKRPIIKREKSDIFQPLVSSTNLSCFFFECLLLPCLDSNLRSCVCRTIREDISH